MVEEVAKAVQLPLISKELYETTHGEAHGTHTVLIGWWKFRIRGFGLSDFAKVFFDISGPYY